MSKKKKQPSVLIAIPTMGWLKAELMTWVQNQEQPFITTMQITPVAFARNKIIDVFLDNTLDYLMMVDHDTLPPPDAIEKLKSVIDDDMTVATGVTPVYRAGQICPNVYVQAQDVAGCVSVSDKSEPFKVAGCGASCLLIPRTVVEKLNKPHFKTIEFDEGKICSEDLYFSQMLNDAGGKIMCHPEVKCQHFKELPLVLQ